MGLRGIKAKRILGASINTSLMVGSPFSIYYKCSWSHELRNWV